MALSPKRLEAEISKEKSNYARLCCLVNDFAEKVLPSSTSKNVEEELATIRQYRSKLAQMHDCPPSIADVDFDFYWKDISDTLIRLGGEKYKEPISDLKYKPMETKYYNCIPNSHDKLELSECLIECRVTEIDAETHEISDHTKRKKTEDFSKGKHLNLLKETDQHHYETS